MSIDCSLYFKQKQNWLKLKEATFGYVIILPAMDISFYLICNKLGKKIFVMKTSHLFLLKLPVLS